SGSSISTVALVGYRNAASYWRRWAAWSSVRPAWLQQGNLEGAGDRGLALAGARRVSDHDDMLAGPGERPEALGRRQARPMIEPVACARAHQKGSKPGPAADAPGQRTAHN